MDNAALVAQRDPVTGRSFGLRVGSVLAALALVFTMVVLLQNRADAAPSVSAAVAGATVGDVSAQINFSQIFCATLLAVRNAFLNSPFFAFIQPLIDQFLALFNCVISG